MALTPQIRIAVTADVQFADSDKQSHRIAFDVPVPDSVAESYVWVTMEPAFISFAHDIAAMVYASSHKPSEITPAGSDTLAPSSAPPVAGVAGASFNPGDPQG